jgi:hypothetical protein
MDDFERFLESLCYPDFAANGILEGAPPRILIVWPKVLSMQVVVKGTFSLKRTQFASDGHCTRFTATLPVSEIRDGRLSAADVRTQGLRRSAASISTPSSGGGTGTGNASGSG